jgi:hypothetical protein
MQAGREPMEDGDVQEFAGAPLRLLSALVGMDERTDPAMRLAMTFMDDLTHRMAPCPWRRKGLFLERSLLYSAI